ncbi:MAG TPA: DUF881 domain-containing protein [Candidatus Gracilibacteria bacterium]|nr:DUF881 domain-containing protein [Candidatus Gracilibacteria bacterium]
MNKYIVLTGIFLGALLTIQFQARFLDQPENSPAQEKIDQTEVLNDLRTERNQLQQEFREIIQAENAKRQSIDPKLTEELRKVQENAGLTEKSGEGLIFKLAAESSKYDLDQQVKDLQNLINILLSAKAEAISINGYRVVFRSYLGIEAKQIYLENNPIASPFEIRAIANPSFLLAGLKNQSDFWAELQKKAKSDKISFEFQESEYLTIPAYLK